MKLLFNSRLMRVNLGIWDKLTRVVIFLLFIAGLLGVAVWYLPLIERNERMRKEILRLDDQVQKQEELSKYLKASIDTLRHDPKAVERLARERLGYAKPGEIVIRFEAPATNSVLH
jgi:cell division protein FtsB